MTNEISIKLQSCIDKANATFGKGMDLVLDAYNQAIADKHTPKQAAKILLDNVIAFKKSTIYSYLPDEAKDEIKARAGASRLKSVPKLEHNASDIVEVETVKEGENVIASAAKQIAEEIEPKQPEEPDSINRPDEQSTDEDDDGTEYHGDAGNNPNLVNKYVHEPQPEKNLIEIVLPDAGAADFGGGLFSAVRNHDKIYFTLDLSRMEITGMETGAERRQKKVMVKAN